MTDPTDPPRLRDAASGAPPGLRDALGAAERDVGSSDQVARLAAKLGPLLAPPAPVGPSAGTTGMSAAAKVGLGALALMIAGGGAWLLSTQTTTPPAHSPPPAVQAAPALETPLPRKPESPAPEPAAPEPAPKASVQPEAPAASAADAKPAPAKPAPVAQLSEAELLEQARSALRGDPARALARANEHRRRFPGGVLVQEREVIAIQALRQLGRGAEADQRAAAFAKAFPGSAFQRKLQPTP